MNKPYHTQLAGTLGFSKLNMLPPPAEERSNVIQFEFSTGCSHSKCTFCDMYGSKKNYSQKDIQQIKNHIDLVTDHLIMNKPYNSKNIDRIFVGGGNALFLPTQTLLEGTQYALKAVRDMTGEIPRRLSMYGNTNDILKKRLKDLKLLNCGGTCSTGCSMREFNGKKRGLDVLYWGLESGNSEVLKIAGKGYDKEKAIKAIELLAESKIRPSIMIIPGLGGAEYFNKHIEDTMAVINKGKPEWITFMGIDEIAKTPYVAWMDKQERKGKNKRLNPEEVVEQTAQMIEKLNVKTKIGIHGKDVHLCGENPVSIGNQDIKSLDDLNRVVYLLRDSAGLEQKDPVINPNEEMDVRDMMREELEMAFLEMIFRSGRRF